jgi:hypothetical protein
MDIIVIRLPGDIEADPIVDALLSTEQVGVSRGRAFLDEFSTYSQNETIEIPYQSGLRTGLLAKVLDESVGEEWFGKIVDIQHSYQESDPGVFTKLEIERRIDRE